MRTSKCKINLISIWIIFLLVMVSFFGILLFTETKNEFNVEAASTWTQTTYNDFNNGTLENVEIIGTNSNADLRLKYYYV